MKVEHADTSHICAYPDFPFLILVDVVDLVGYERVGIVGVMVEYGKFFFGI